MGDEPRDLYANGLTEPLKEILWKQKITSEGPRPILSDVEALIGAIGEGIPTSSGC